MEAPAPSRSRAQGLACEWLGPRSTRLKRSSPVSSMRDTLSTILYEDHGLSPSGSAHIDRRFSPRCVRTYRVVDQSRRLLVAPGSTSPAPLLLSGLGAVRILCLPQRRIVVCFNGRESSFACERTLPSPCASLRTSPRRGETHVSPSLVHTCSASSTRSSRASRLHAMVRGVRSHGHGRYKRSSAPSLAHASRHSRCQIAMR